MKNQFVVSSLLALTIIPASIAAEPPCDPATAAAAPEPIGTDVKKVMQQLKPSDQASSETHLLDANFRYSVIKQNGYLKAQSFTPDYTTSSYMRVYDLLNVTTGKYALFNTLNSSAKSYDQALQILKQQSGTLSTNEKLLYLSLLGSTLSRGYEATGKTSRSPDATFQNMMNNGQQGGICGSIHEYIGQAANALGFQAPGINSGDWTATGVNHYVAFFKDPKTGTFYSQNYSRIIDTGATTVQGAVDVATQMLAPLTGVSAVKSRPGTFHMVVPNTAQWVEQQLSKGTNFNSGTAIVSIDTSNKDTQVAVQIQKQLGPDSRVKGFAVHSEYYADDGKYGLDAIGIATDKQKKLGPALGGIIDEVNVAGKVYGGYLQLSAPDPLSNSQNTRKNFFIGTQVKGAARIDQITGSLVIDSKTIDFQNMRNASGNLEIRPGIEWASETNPLKINAERLIEATPRDTSQFRPDLHTAYDKVSVIVDTRDKEEKSYLVMNGSVYAMEGVGKNAATGLRAQLKGVIPTDSRGEFIVVADASKIARNPSKDPFYDTPLSKSLSLTWRKAVTKAIEIGATLDVRKNKINSAFTDSNESAVPGISDIDNGTKKVATVWLRSKW